MAKFQLEDIDETTIIAYLKGDKDDIELSPKVKEQIDNMQIAHDLLYRYGSRFTVSKFLMKRLNISRNTANKHIDRAMFFFGTIHKPQKDYYRQLSADIIMKALAQASAASNWDAVAKLSNALSKTLGFDLEDSKIPEWRDIVIPQVIMGFFPGQTGVELPSNSELKEQIWQMVKDKKGIDLGQFFKNVPDANQE